MRRGVKLIAVAIKLEPNKNGAKEDSSSENDDSVFGDSLETGDIIDIVSPLPCEDPSLNPWGGVVYGKEVDPAGNSRSASTGVNRIEFPDTFSTLKPRREANTKSRMVWDQGTYTGYKLNCHKKKRKVESMVELFNKDSITSVQDEKIFMVKLGEISAAALEALEYISEILAELETNEEHERITEIQAIKKIVLDTVKENEREVKVEMERLLSEATRAVLPPPPPTTDGAHDIQQVVQQALANLNLSGPGVSNNQPNSKSGSDLVARLTLRYSHVHEDASDFQKLLASVKLASDMSDSEVIYFMRKSETWTKKVEELVASNRKFQEEALGNEDLAQMAEQLNEKVQIVKQVKENKMSAISQVDLSRGLNSLCENKNKASVVFPEPFKGIYGENVFKFKEEIVAAIKDSQVKKSDEVKTLVKYLKGDAKARVGDHQPSLEKALDVLLEFYGNPNLIWSKCREDFRQKFTGNVVNVWGDLGSTKRIDAIASVLGFIRQAKQYAEEYPKLHQEILSSNTMELLTESMPIDYLEMVFLAINDTGVTESQKIDKMEEILGKLKTCGILAANQLASKESLSKKHVGTKANTLKHLTGTVPTILDPLGSSTNASQCSVDVRHKCHRSPKCEPAWGLLGCVELYKLKTVEDRIAYCKSSKCCYVCGMADLSGTEISDSRHRRCDYKNPVERFHTRCTAQRFVRSLNKKVPCFIGAALCPDHQSIKNTSQKLLDWLEDKKIDHQMFNLKGASNNKAVNVKTSKKEDKVQEHKTDQEVMEILRNEMTKSDTENGKIEDIPEGENIFMFLLLQGKQGTEPIQVFCDSGANFWFAVESVTRKLISVRTFKGALPISVAGGKTVYSTGEWAAAIPLADGTYQGVRGLTMKSVVGQMPRYSLDRVLKEVKSQYKENQELQKLKIPPVLGGEIDMILGSKYLKIYPDTVQVTPSGLTVSVSKLRSPGGMKSAVISGPVKILNQIFESRHARDCLDSMKAMLLQVSNYRPTLEYFPKSPHISGLMDPDVPGAADISMFPINEVEKNMDAKTRSDPRAEKSASSCSVCGVTVQGELQKFMDFQEAGLRTDFRCKDCRQCEECRKGAGHERLSLRQEAEQQLIKESVTIDEEEGVAIAQLPFIIPPEENLQDNRSIALGMLNGVLKKYCKDMKMRGNIAGAWEKMINKGHLVYFKDLSQEHQQMLSKAQVSYWIPWNIQFKESLSTPIRPVLNASCTTTTGFSLNDCLAKGTPDLVDLLSVMLDWQMGASAFCGDISQFYPTIKLTPNHWQYQRILLKENLDPKGDLLEAVLVKLGFGVQSVSAQTEEIVRRMAKKLLDTFPEVAALLIKRRYVDDMAKSTKTKQESLYLIQKTSEILASKLSMNIKGWAVAGERPPPDITKDGSGVDLGGILWYPETDLFTLNFPPLCFDKKKRGKLSENSVFYNPKETSLEKFVPLKLTRRMITRAVAKLWDMMGKITPVTLRLKHDLRKLIAESPEWDSCISQPARALWIQNFEIMDNVRDFVYVRNNRPPDALRTTCRLWILVDAAEWGMIITVYVGWERPGGSYSCSHLYGKGILGPEALTLPQKELHILSVGADVSELLSVMLNEWVEEILVAGDSEIALCWAAYETVKLNQYNRVRVINILSKLSLENLFHIKGSENSADIGTRMKAISAVDVQPGSEYLCGKEWMKFSKQKAIKAGVIKPVNDIKLGHEQKKVMKKGIVFDSFEKADEDLIAVLVHARLDVQKVAEREAENLYPYSPLARNFLSFVNIIALLMKTARKMKRNWQEKTNKEVEEVTQSTSPKFSIQHYYSDKVVKLTPHSDVMDMDRDRALEFIFRTESKLVKKFNSKNKLDKIAVELDGILYYKTRILEGQTVKVVGGLNIDTSVSGIFNLNFKVPIIDQHSPLAFPLALHLHSLFNHRGVESCHRLALNYVKILGSIQIFRNISLNCIICMKDRKKYLRMAMGSLTDSQLSVSPLFYFTMVDMWGPLTAYCPGYERATRRDKSYQVYFLVFSCVATGAVNVQLLEGKSTEFVLEGCTRFFNETSVPKIMFPDEDGALVKAFKEGEINVQDLSGNLHKSKGILFETCTPQAHSQHGKVERAIKSLQESFNRSGASNIRCTATGWQTLGKSMEREINNIPIGFLYDQTNNNGNPLLRILRPSSLKGMNNSDRAPRGLFTIPDLPQNHFNKVQEAYNLWFKCWATSYIPVILEGKKWAVSDQNLQVNDIVYFKIEDSALKPIWKVGKVDSVKEGRDGLVREVNVAHKIIKEETWSHSVVTRPAREIIKLFEIGDTTFAEDLKAVQKAAKEILTRRGASTNTIQELMENWPGVGEVKIDEKGNQVEANHSINTYEAFLSCSSAGDWFDLENSAEGEEDAGSLYERAETNEYYENDELLLLV